MNARGVHVIVRSVRGSLDLDYEMQMAGMNQQLDARVETVFLMPAPAYAHIASSLVRQIARLGGDVSSFVAPEVVKALQGLKRN